MKPEEEKIANIWEVIERLKKEKILFCSWVGNLSAINTSVLKWIFGFNASPIRTPTGFCVVLGNLSILFIWIYVEEQIIDAEIYMEEVNA